MCQSNETRLKMYIYASLYFSLYENSTEVLYVNMTIFGAL